MFKQSWFVGAVVNRLSNARLARRARRRTRQVRHDFNLESLEPRVVLSASPGTLSPLANLGYVADDGPLQTIHLNTDDDPQGDDPFKYSFGSSSPHYGGKAHTILSGDFDGDGDDTVVAAEEVPYFETGDLQTKVHLRWLIDDNRDTTDEFRFRFGLVGDIPLVGDMNGDGIDDAIVVRAGTVPVNGPLAAMTWYISYGPFPAQNGSPGAFADVDATAIYAFNGDTPIVGDWDGDGVDDLGLVSQQPSADGYFQWYKHSYKTGISVEKFGKFSPNHVPVAGDFDGDGIDEPGYVERRSDGQAVWHIQTDNDPDPDVSIAFGSSKAQFLVGQWTQPDIRINDTSIVEGDNGQKNLRFTVSLTSPGDALKAHPSQVPVSVNFSTAEGTARSVEDYIAKSGKLTFQPGETQKTIDIPIVGNTIHEGTETFDVRLQNSVNGRIADATGRGTIIDNDPPVAGPNVARIADAAITEGNSGRRNMEFVVTVTRANNDPVKLSYRTADDSAKSGQDFDAVQGTLTFNAGETRKSIFVPIIGDTLDELDEKFTVELQALQNAVFGDESAIGTIIDDDKPSPKPGSIAGLKWNDLDGDGIRDANEPGLSNWTIYIDQNRNGRLDGGERSTQTDAQGRYLFSNVAPGEYYVSEIVQPGWRQTFPGNGSSASVSGFASDGLVAGTSSRIGGQVDHPVALTTTASTVPIYVDSPEVGVLGDFLPQLDQSGSLIGIDDFRNDARFRGIDGSGFATVIIDTGIDVDHPFFGADADGNGVADRIVYQYDFVNERPDASDTAGHGSHVAGIALSQDGRYTGMAPGSDIIALKVLDNGGSFADLEQALQWVVTNASRYNIASVNMSLGNSANYSSPVSLFGLDDELRELARMGVIVVSAAGNDFASYQSEGVSYPAADPNSLAVSSVFSADFGPVAWRGGAIDFTSGPDRIVSHSQRHAQLTDVFAPGALIVSASNTGGTDINGGTSMAAPHVAGVATLAQQLAEETLGRRLTMDEFRSLLNNSGETIFDGDDENDNVRNTSKDYKRLDVMKLAEAILDLGRVNPHIVTVRSGEAVTGINFGGQRLAPNASIANATPVAEGETAVFNVMLDRAYSETVSVSWEADGLRNPVSGTVTFAPGETMRTIEFETDGVITRDGQITTRLTTVEQARIANGVGKGMVSREFSVGSASTAIVAFDATTGTLNVDAVSSSRIRISSSDGQVNVTVNGNSVTSSGTARLTADAVRSIIVTGSSEDDSINLSGVTPESFPALSSVELHGLGGDDTIVGSQLDDDISGGSGDDMLSGLSGNDRLTGDAGADTISGGDGDDFIQGRQGRDSLSGDDGDDSIDGGQQADTITGGDGHDMIRGGGGADHIYGGDGDDQIKGGAGNDELVGDSGEDTITGQSGRDSIQGGAGADVLFGLAGADTLAGGSGEDILTGGFTIDQIVGRATADAFGEDTLGTFDSIQVLITPETDKPVAAEESIDRLPSVETRTSLTANSVKSANSQTAPETVDFIAEVRLLDAVFAD